MDRVITQDCLAYLKKIDLSPLSGKTVCITGANGLIGTYIIYMFHLANLYQNAGIQILAVSRNQPCDKLEDIFKDNYQFYAVDLTTCSNFDFLGKTDYIVHGATYAQPEKFLKNYSDTIHLNTTVTESLLLKAKQDEAKFLFLSSSEVYGDPDEAHIPTPEDYPGLCSPVCVRSVYSESKRMGETLCFASRNFEAVDAKIARISMSYGPGVSIHDGRVLGNFLKQALKNKKIVMLDDGSKIRTFCYIADCVLMLLHILLYGKDFVYNVGGNDQITIRRLAEEICLLTESTLAVEPSPQTPSQNIKVSPMHVELDTSKVQTEFHLPPLKPFREGIARTIQWNVEQNTV